jgi:hypothetical protein
VPERARRFLLFLPNENTVQTMWVVCGGCGKFRRPELAYPYFPPAANTILDFVHKTWRLN